MTIEHIIRKEIKSSGLKKTFIAEKVGIQSPYLTTVIKSDSRNIQLKLALKILSVFDSKAHFLNGETMEPFGRNLNGCTTLKQLHKSCNGNLMLSFKGKNQKITYESKAKKTV